MYTENKFIFFFTKKLGITLVMILNSSYIWGQSLLFEANKGQWSKEVLYKTDVPGARIFLGKEIITYAMYDEEKLKKLHLECNESDIRGKEIIKCHSIKVHFLGINKTLDATGLIKSESYVNYFIGSDATQWASAIPEYNKVKYTNLYHGIDLLILSENNNFKYEFHIASGADPNQIQLKYEGSDGLFINNRNLIVTTSVNNLTEQKPIAWQNTSEGKKFIDCEFSLNENTVSFVFPQGFDQKLPIIIDPIVVASTYSGASIMTNAHSATYDLAGNIYTGGRIFSPGYPLTTGAYQTTFGGNTDAIISVYNGNGTTRIYSTYLGGSSDDFIHSMIVDSLTNQLCIYGSTFSSDYPTTTGAFDISYNGLADIIITRFSTSGTNLIGSTYVGGSASDGWNLNTKNHGDTFRGEIMFDDSGNIYISSFSSSINFPTTVGTFDVTHNGSQDGVILCVDQNLSNLLWSTFIGGTGSDAPLDFKFDSFGNIYIAGVTSSADFPTSIASHQFSFQGGANDGFICYLSSNGSSLSFSTYFGTTSYDGIFFIDIDASDNVYIYGITEGTLQITSGKYGNPGSRQFIAKFESTLNNLLWQTTFGNGNTSDKFSPTGFMIDRCNHIYAVGWGLTAGFPISANAVQSTAGNFYVIVLGSDADTLLHATYYGSNGDHVDGGICQLDNENGVIYQAVCTDKTSFPTLPGSVSTTNNTNQTFDIALFKIDFELSNVVAQASPGTIEGCAPLNVSFGNQSNGVTYFWDFGDGDTSILPSPTHVFLNPGVYDVMMIAIDSSKCNIRDTVYIVIQVFDSIHVNLGPDTTACLGATILLDAGNPGSSYLWSYNETTQSINITSSGSYSVLVSNDYCEDTDTINIQFFSIPSVNLGADTTLCNNNIVTLDAGNNGNIFSWSTGDTSQIIQIDTTGIYWVNVGYGECSSSDTIFINMYEMPIPYLGTDTNICEGQQLILSTGINYTHDWSTGDTVNFIIVSTPGIYTVTVTNQICSATDTIIVNLEILPEFTLTDLFLCSAETIVLDAGNPGFNYLWSTGENTQAISISSSGLYSVKIYDNYCFIIDSAFVNYTIITTEDKSLVDCDMLEIILDAGNDGANYNWSNGLTAQSIAVNQSGSYWVKIEKNGCVDTSNFNVEIINEESTLFIPNSFTPNNDGLNEIFKAFTNNTEFLELKIFNRWGELIFSTTDSTNGWNGTHKGKELMQGVYIYKLNYKSMCDSRSERTKIGKIFLIK